MLCCLAFASSGRTGEFALDRFGGLKELSTKSAPFFRLAKFGKRDLLVTPDGHGFLALGINHIGSLAKRVPGGIRIDGREDWNQYWTNVLKPRFADWHCNTTGYGGPTAYRSRAPWFGTIGIAPIEKHRSDPRPGKGNAYHFPDVFDDGWGNSVAERIGKATKEHLNDPFLVGWFWTDTPTWDLYKTRALRRTDWVSELRSLPVDSPGRAAYESFLRNRYSGRIHELNEIYSWDLTSLDELTAQDFSRIAVGRHRVQEDDHAFLAVIAKRFYRVVGEAQRKADPNHLVFGDRYLAGDSPTFVLQAVTPWIDAVAVQPGDRYTPQYPASTHYPAAEIAQLHQVTGKPVLICDHAISFPTAAEPRTIFEQMPNEDAAAKATLAFLDAAFAKPYQLGYLRCQYVDRRSGFGRGLRQGLIRVDDSPRETLVNAYRTGFANALLRVLADGR